MAVFYVSISYVLVKIPLYLFCIIFHRVNVNLEYSYRKKKQKKKLFQSSGHFLQQDRQLNSQNRMPEHLSAAQVTSPKYYKQKHTKKRRGSKLHIAVLSLKTDSSRLSSLVVFPSLLPITQSVRALFCMSCFSPGSLTFQLALHTTPFPVPTCFILLGQEHGLQAVLTQKLLRGESRVCSRLQKRKTEVDYKGLREECPDCSFVEKTVTAPCMDRISCHRKMRNYSIADARSFCQWPSVMVYKYLQSVIPCCKAGDCAMPW